MHVVLLSLGLPLDSNKFQAELNDLRRSKRGGLNKVFDKKETDFLVKWDLLWVPSKILDSESGIPDLGSETIEVYEPFFQFPVRKPVTAIDLYDAYPDRIVCTCDAEDLGSPPRGVLLEILVDLRYPRDVIISLIEQELRKAQKRPRPQQRQHLDKVDFHLKVYDLAEQGDTFAAIANTLGKPKSTVKSAFIAVRRNIFGSAPVHSKKRLPLVDFNLNRHLMECSVCKAAEQFEDMCWYVPSRMMQRGFKQYHLV